MRFNVGCRQINIILFYFESVILCISITLALISTLGAKQRYQGQVLLLFHHRLNRRE